MTGQSQEKSPTVEILGKYFLWTIVSRKYMRKIPAVGLFCCDKFEETPKQKVIDLSKLKKNYFNIDMMWHEFSRGIHKAIKVNLNFKFLFWIKLYFCSKNMITVWLSRTHIVQKLYVVQTNLTKVGMTYLYCLKPKELYFHVGYSI